MHVFLTGAVGVGKSTAIKQAISMLGLPVGGFCSGYGPDRGEPDRWLYLWYAGGEPVYEQSNAVAKIVDHRPNVIPGRFDELGCAALQRAGSEKVGLIVMDECGRLERQEQRFCEAVLDLLNGEVPVLGALGRGQDDWLDAIRNHPKVTVLTVTEENRDELPKQIADLLTTVS